MKVWNFCEFLWWYQVLLCFYSFCTIYMFTSFNIQSMTTFIYYTVISLTDNAMFFSLLKTLYKTIYTCLYSLTKFIRFVSCSENQTKLLVFTTLTIFFFWKKHTIIFFFFTIISFLAPAFTTDNLRAISNIWHPPQYTNWFKQPLVIVSC